MKQKKLKFEVVAKPRFVGTARVARAIGCHPNHLSCILHGTRKANDTLRRRLWRLGIVKTVDGREI